MKIRSSDQLLEHLSNDLSWRLAEIAELENCVTIAKPSSVDVHVRAGVTMLYAHWEGFVKSSANAYVSYLAHRGDRNRDLKTCFVALGMKSLLAPLGDSKKANVAIAAVSYLRDQQEKAVRLSSASIGTGSNLNSEVFKNIADWLGIDHAPYATCFATLDGVLLANRNAIAHGEHLRIDTARFQRLVGEVIEMLHRFKTDIENAVDQRSFLSPIPSQVGTATNIAAKPHQDRPPST